jgi:rSAM/selenodomain-associated transferase 2
VSCWRPPAAASTDAPPDLAGAPAVPISIILPTLNEADLIEESLVALRPLRAAGHEVVVVDGGSVDGTPSRAEPHAERVLSSPPGRARQMNAGARMARGEVLLFLHADTRLPEQAAERVCTALHPAGRAWGRFDVRLSGAHPLLRVVERMMNLRSCLTGIATGDQALFVRRTLFESVGGYPEVALMEDIALCKLLKKHGRPVCLHRPVVTSSRRWENRGVLRTVLLMWGLRLAYFLGVSPQRLARLYYPERPR